MNHFIKISEFDVDASRTPFRIGRASNHHYIMNNATLAAHQVATTNVVKVAYEDGIPSASVEVYGDKWCVLGNGGLSDVVDDSFVFGERNVFGFALVE